MRAKDGPFPTTRNPGYCRSSVPRRGRSGWSSVSYEVLRRQFGVARILVLFAADGSIVAGGRLVELEASVGRLLGYTVPERVHLALRHRLESRSHAEVLTQP